MKGTTMSTNSQNQTSFIEHFCVCEGIEYKVKGISSLDVGDNLVRSQPNNYANWF